MKSKREETKQTKLNNVFPLPRESEYIAERAKQNALQGRAHDALKLIAKAAEESSNDASLMTEASIMFAEAGLPEKSSEYLTEAIRLRAGVRQLRLAMHMNLILRGKRCEANALLIEMAENRTNYAHAIKALEFESEHNISNERYVTRQEIRAIGNIKKYIRRSVKDKSYYAYGHINAAIADCNDKAYANAATALILVNIDRDKAMTYADAAARALKKSRKEPPTQTIFLVCRALSLCSKTQLAAELLKTIDVDFLPRELYDQYIQELARADQHRAIYDFCVKRLGEEQFDVKLLHARSVAAASLKLDDKQVLSGWNIILSADKTNLICKCFTEAYRSGKLTGEVEEYSFALTADMRLALYKQYADKPADELTKADVNSLLYANNAEELQELGVLLAIKMPRGKAPNMRMLSERLDLSDSARKAAKDYASLNAKSGKNKLMAILNPVDKIAKIHKMDNEALWAMRLRKNVTVQLNNLHMNSKILSADRLLYKILCDESLRKLALRKPSQVEAALLFYYTNDDNFDRIFKSIKKEYKYHLRDMQRMEKLFDKIEGRQNNV